MKFKIIDSLELQYSESGLFKYVHEQINRIPKGIISYIYAAQERGLLQPNEDPVTLGQYLFRKLYTKLDKSLAHNAYLMYINRQKQRADKWHKKHPDAATETA